MKGVMMRAGADGAPRMTLHGVVGWDIDSRAVADALAGARGKRVTVSINSPGGDAFAGIAIHNMLARHDGGVTVVVDGFAASAASLIAMAGRPTIMPANAFLMLHNAHGVQGGESDDLRAAADVLDSVSAAYRRTYAARSGKAEDEVAEMMAAETWLGAADAVAMGFADEMAKPTEIRASAADLAMLPRVPAALTAAVQAVPASSQLKEAQMGEPTEKPVAPAPDVKAAAPLATVDVDAQLAAEGMRVEAIYDAAEKAKKVIADHAKVEAVRAEAVKGKLSVEQFRARMFELMQAAEPPFPATRRSEITVIRDGDETTRARMASGLSALMRAHRGRPVPEEAREFYGMRLSGMLREMLARAGARDAHRLSGAELWERFTPQSSAHTTSDFPIVLRDAVNKTLQQEFALLPATWNAWTQQIDVADFKTITSAQIGTMPDLQRVSEGQPVPYGGVLEEGESYRVETFATIVELSRQAIINDDLNAFGRLIAGAAETGYRRLADEVYGVLRLNANMADGNRLFSAAHGNVGAGASGTIFHYLVAPDRPTVEIAYLGGRRMPEITEQVQFNNLGAAYRVLFDFGTKAISWRGMTRERAAVNADGTTVAPLEALLMTQRTVGGARIAPPTRLVLLVPPSEHLAARRLATAVTPDSASNVNIYGSRIELVVEPRLADTTVV